MERIFATFFDCTKKVAERNAGEIENVISRRADISDAFDI